MFGYIIVNKQEMKFRDFELYQSYYCGFCRKLKEKYGIRGQLTLSYDMTFLILLLSGLYEAQETAGSCKCVAHPFDRHSTRSNQFTEYAADMNVILTYYHCMDDWEDEKKLLKRGYAGVLKPAFQKAESLYPEKAKRIERELVQLKKYERDRERNLDMPAGCFGNIMAEIFACRQDEWEENLRIMGFFLGKYIYIMDAYEDLEEDLRKQCYNPLKSLHERADYEEQIRQILCMMIAECSAEFEKLPCLLDVDILRNILYDGVWNRYNKIQKKKLEEGNKKNEQESL
jgi:hypothetical protein